MLSTWCCGLSRSSAGSESFASDGGVGRRGREHGSRRGSLLSLSGNREVGSTRSVPISVITFFPPQLRGSTADHVRDHRFGGLLGGDGIVSAADHFS